MARSPAKTRRLGAALGRVLRPGDFVGLVGDLGAGKTEFVRGVAAGAGVPVDEVASPTFAIVYPYRGRIPLHHADLYRLSDEDELYATGLSDLMGGESALLVEWIDRIWSAAPKDRLEVRLTVRGAHARRLDASATGSSSRALLDAWIRATRR
ncbi:MAG TPA: tRNA (adenosine(37)-N6)-threonylcarbamoyltransferase complex ATPase subunit type 1 TsaE [Myxococcaceae bacterium]|nr:tRNA (adenosine(37)-N6)-threonylcarbamoyltransferase complex ATPase subunit type 1 TsaE [Myxococcaceae bacterium]